MFQPKSAAAALLAPGEFAPLCCAGGAALVLHLGVLAALLISSLSLRLSLETADESGGPLELLLASPFELPRDELTNQDVEAPRAAEFAVHNMLPETLFDTPSPEFKKPNGFSDSEDGGTVDHAVALRSGGGGGDEAGALEFGHVISDEKTWGRLKIRHVAEARSRSGGDENGVRDSAPGILKSPGAGTELGNGQGSGALASQGSGSGAGAGRGGVGTGNGLGREAPVGPSTRPQVISMERGYYPPEARNARHEGTAIVTVEVLASGSVGRVEVRTSSGYSELDQAAVAAAKAWRFTGALKNGRPVNFWYAIPFSFGLVVESSEYRVPSSQ